MPISPLPKYRLAAAAVLLGGCSAVEFIGGSLAATVGISEDSYCDRRFVSDDKADKRTAFCQDIVDTVADSEFREDCSKKFGARTGTGRCDRGTTIGGCAVSEVERDGSQVTDWFYLTDFDDAGPRNKDDVGKLCGDRSRYERGASFVTP